MWQEAKNEHLSSIINALKVKEWECTHFAAKLRPSEVNNYFDFINNKIYIYLVPGMNSITSAILSTSYGLVYPYTLHEDMDELSRFPVHEITRNGRPVSSIMGMSREVAILRRLFEKQGYSFLNIDYLNMTFDDFSNFIFSDDELLQGETICLAGEKDAYRLFNLQKAYELEEVVVFPEKYNESACLAHLKRNLASETIMYLQKGNTIIAKAGTNARGFNYYQLGGVYTVKSWRKQGAAYRLMKGLMKKIAQKGKKINLFVKKSNNPALQLYRGLGFTLRNDFTISYRK